MTTKGTEQMRSPQATSFTASGRRERLLLSDVAFWLTLTFAVLAVAFPPARYLVFLSPVIVATVILADGAFVVRDEFLPFGLYITAGLVLAPIGNLDGMKDVLFVLSGVAIALAPRVPYVSPERLLAIYLLAASGFFAAFGTGAATFSISNSESPLESSFGFVFPAIALYAFFRGRVITFLIAAVLAVAALKRITLVAVLCVVALYYLGEHRGRYILNPFVMVVVNLVALAALIAYGAGAFDMWIVDWTGQSANQLGLGRRVLLQLPATEMLRNPAAFIFGGSGGGTSYELATRGALQFGGKANLHSDIVKIAYEFGILIFIAFFALLYFSKSYVLRLYGLFLNILFITDNTLVYYFFLLPVMYCARMTVGEEVGGRRVALKRGS